MLCIYRFRQAHTSLSTFVSVFLIRFIPFPFPHAQLAVLFVVISIPAVAFLMDQYADSVVLGSILTFFSVACLSGIHEVARELENPFRNIPNELPLVTFQAQFNEALVVMYSGYHPDHFWNPKHHDHHPLDPSPRLRRYGSKNRSSMKRSTSGGAPKPEAKTESTAATTAATESAAARGAPATPPHTPVVCAGRGGENSDLTKMHAKLEEYGKEIERLRKLLENSEEKKHD